MTKTVVIIAIISYNNREEYKHRPLYLPFTLSTISGLGQGNFDQFAFDIFMWESHCWNPAAQKITHRFPTLLNVVHQQLLWWNKGLDTVVVLTVSLMHNTS